MNAGERYTFRIPNGGIGLLRCLKCLLENYVMSVITGICAWCAYDGNGKGKSTQNNNNSAKTLKNGRGLVLTKTYE
jgi:hypothetical protein